MRSAKSRDGIEQAANTLQGGPEHARRIEARARQRAREELIASEHDRIARAFAASELGERELARARQQVAKWAREGICSAWYTSRWSDILSGRPLEVAERLLSLEPAERKALYQNTPFGFLLTERVRG